MLIWFCGIPAFAVFLGFVGVFALEGGNGDPDSVYEVFALPAALALGTGPLVGWLAIQDGTTRREAVGWGIGAIFFSVVFGAGLWLALGVFIASGLR